MVTGDLFEFTSVTLRRGDTTILDDLTVSVPATGVTAIVGASGSGKSTLLRCCNLLESPSSGQITFRGDALTVLDPRVLRRRVAMVFQRPTVFPGTALDNLRAADRRLDSTTGAVLLERVGLDPVLLTREADAQSGGEAQRLCLARALATEPDVVLADESTSALDAGSTAVLEELAKGLAASGVPVVWVTHDAAQTERIADHLIELDHGRLVTTREMDR